MTHKFIIEKTNKVKKAVPLIESKIKIKIRVMGTFVSVEGSEYNEYLVEKILKAVDFGFETEDALMLLDENFELEFINVKEHTHRKNLTEIRARIIGTGGKAKRTIEELTAGAVVLNGNMVGIIVDSEHLSQATQGIISLIQGSKHGNVFSYLEKQNAELRRLNEEDLGLRESMRERK
jgi:ribosomal RNA assembly protein